MTTAPVAPATTAPAPPLSLGALLSLCLMAPVASMSLTGMSPVMPLIGAEFAEQANSEVMVRLMMSGLSAAMILGALLSGMLSDKLGKVQLLVWSLSIYGLAGAAIFLLDNLYLMVVCRIVQGVAVAAAGVLAMALITTRVPADRSDKWVGFYLVSGMVGIILLFSAIGAIASYGWRYTFLLFLLGLPLALLLALFLPKEKGAAGEAGRASDAPSGKKPAIPWALAAFGVLCGAISAASPMFLPYHLGKLGLGEPGMIAILMVGGTVTTGLTTFSFGWLRRRLSAIQVFVIGFLLNASGLVLIGLATGWETVLAGMLVQGTGLGLLMPNVFSACAAAARPEWRARLLGFVRAGMHAGPLVAQPVLEVIYRHSTAGSTLLAIALASLGGAVWVMLGRRLFDPAD